MATDIIKLPLCLESARFKLVTGLVGQSKRVWQEFVNRLNFETRHISYREEQGLEGE